jgi:hypothetical protein
MARAPLTHPAAFPEARFRALSGTVELAVAEAAAARATRPERVTAVLAAIYDRIAGQRATPALTGRLASGTREWLLQRAALRFRADLEWFEASCTACGAAYDLAMSVAAAPRKPPGPDFPVITVETSLGPRPFEAPCGLHEEQAAQRPGDDPRRTFATLCGLADDAASDAARFIEDDLARIDAALEALAPEVASSAAAVCPSCGGETAARMEPLRFTFPKPMEVLAEVHLLASAYHWSEGRILALSPERRRDYAELILHDRTGRRRPLRSAA